MKKIIHIITRLDKGGSTEDTLFTASKFNDGKEYISKIIYGWTADPSEGLIAVAVENKVEFINIPRLIRDINPFEDILAFIKIAVILKHECPDIVHTHTSKAGILGRWAAFLVKTVYKKKIMIIHSSHGHIFYGYFNKFVSKIIEQVEKVTSWITDMNIVLTENEFHENISRGIGYPKKYCVIHSGIDYDTIVKETDLRKSLSISDKAFIIGSLGRIDEVKGYLYFVQAAALITRKYPEFDVKYLIVGDGKQRKFIENKIKELKIEDKFILTGWRDNITDYLNIINIYVQPSLNEGLGKTILQAQMMGKPIIATKVQGVISTINDRYNGMLVAPGNPQELAETLIKLIWNKDFREMLGKNAKASVFDKSGVTGYYKFSIEQMLFLYEKLYNKILLF